MRIASWINLIFTLNFLKFGRISRRQFICTPVGQIKTLMRKDIAHDCYTTCEASWSDITSSIIERAVSSSGLHFYSRYPNTVIRQIQIMPLHDFFGVRKHLNSCANFFRRSIKNTLLLCSFVLRPDTRPFCFQLISRPQFNPHALGIVEIKKLILRCTFSARGLRFTRKRQTQHGD